MLTALNEHYRCCNDENVRRLHIIWLKWNTLICGVFRYIFSWVNCFDECGTTARLCNTITNSNKTTKNRRKPQFAVCTMCFWTKCLHMFLIHNFQNSMTQLQFPECNTIYIRVPMVWKVTFSISCWYFFQSIIKKNHWWPIAKKKF